MQGLILSEAYLKAKFTATISAYLTAQWPVLSFASGHVFPQTFLALFFLSGCWSEQVQLTEMVESQPGKQ